MMVGQCLGVNERAVGGELGGEMAINKYGGKWCLTITGVPGGWSGGLWEGIMWG